MAASSNSGGEELTREERRDQYERVCSIVEHNTGGKQRPMASLHSVRTIAKHAGIDAEDVDKRLKRGVKNGDLVIVEGRVCLAEESSVRAAIRYEANREHPRQERMGKLNQALDGVVDSGE